ncbi:MAG: helix-turn-helix domain-containing protein [Shinella sp.]|nr:helix-turn-helix domain-containing protein [Shinella sp.]
MSVSGENNVIPLHADQTDGDTLGGRIWRARDALEMSLADLAARLGLPESVVNDWERDHVEPGSKALFVLAEVLCVSPAWLVAGVGKAPDAYATAAIDIHPLLEKLRHVRDLHDQTGRAISSLEAELAKLLASQQR